jgi:hypothetical protein
MPFIHLASQSLYCSASCAAQAGIGPFMLDPVDAVDIPFGYCCGSCGALLSNEMHHIVEVIVRVDVATTSEDISQADKEQAARKVIGDLLCDFRHITTFYDHTVRAFRRLEITAKLAG